MPYRSTPPTTRGGPEAVFPLLRAFEAVLDRAARAQRPTQEPRRQAPAVSPTPRASLRGLGPIGDPGERAARAGLTLIPRQPPVLRGPQRPDRPQQPLGQVPAQSRLLRQPSPYAGKQLEWPVRGFYELNKADKPGEGQGTFHSRRVHNGRVGKHEGVDIFAPKGEPVVAAADGLVVPVGENNLAKSYGRQVVIDHGGGLCTQSAHLSPQGAAEPGARVRKGDVIGYVDKTGNPPKKGDLHVHFEVRPKGCSPFGAVADPMLYFQPSSRR